VNSGVARARKKKKKKKRNGGLPGGRLFLRELKLSVICCWTVVLFLLCSIFSVFLLLPASVSCFSFSSSASSGGDVVVDGGLRWHWWLQTVALLCGGGQCLLLFDLPVCGEAQASSSSRVLQQGEEDGEKLTVVLVTG
jgi:hypothetical protein